MLECMAHAEHESAMTKARRSRNGFILQTKGTEGAMQAQLEAEACSRSNPASMTRTSASKA
jgi:hypothetical protein